MTNHHTAANRQKYSGVIRVLFLVYLLFLIWAILWKFNPPYVGNDLFRSLNLIPFNGNSFSEMRFNVLIFIPFGFFCSALLPEHTFFRKVLFAFLASTALEAIQYVLGIGHSDVTDVVMNTLGGIVGIAAYFALVKLFPGKKSIATLIACLLVTALVLAAVAFFALLGRIRIA